MPLVNDGWCFACGDQNPIGLRLKFEATGDGVAARFVADRRYQGYQGVLHGGIVMTLLDEAQVYAVAQRFGYAVTAELRTRLRSPAPVGEELLVMGRVTDQRLRLVQSESKVVDSSGRIIAEATGKFMLSNSRATE